MRTRQSMGRRALAAFLLLLLLTAAAVQACAENTVGIARVYGYKDKIVSDDRKFAPYAILRDEAHSSKYTLKYKYTKGDNYTRTWTLWMLNDKGEPVNHHKGGVDVYLPYPSIWSEDQQAYWKWTKAYAERFDWTMSKAMLEEPYTRKDESPVKPFNAFGFRVTFYDGIAHKTVTIKMQK